MADTERDRFGDKLRDRQKGQEDDYFGRRDRELLEKMRQQRRQALQKPTATMQCPRCHSELVERVHHDVTVDECPSCGGLWLDKGEFELIAGREQEGYFGRLLRERLSGG
ncbi:zf-TFIIB domain-containing protein [bacterium]|nr:zf-TFIIB domain-containing protein [bacterium]